MKLNITIDFRDFLDEAQGSFDDFVRQVIKDEILKLIRKDPQWKEFIAACAKRAIEKAQNA